ncbi:hypothetical protein [Pseudomonas fluorescens]
MSTSQSNAIAPAIVSVKGSSGEEIANGGTTNETSVIIAGEGGKHIELMDGRRGLGAVSADSTGRWTFSMTEWSLGLHSITAHASSGTSLPWTFTVVPNK